MALSDFFGGGGLLGGGGDPLDMYGDLFTEKQKAALQQRQMNEGLLRLAGAFGQAAQPSRMPTSFLGSLGQAAGALAGSGDEATKTALSAMKVGEDVRASKQQREWTAKLLPSLVAKLKALEQANGLPQGSLTSQIPGAGAATTAPPAGAPPPADAPPPAAASPVSMGLPAAGMSPFGLPDAPAPGSMPPPGAPPQQQTGLLPPQDQMVGPGGQPLQGPGILPTMNASYGGAPGGRPPFRLASSTPTGSATPGAAGRDPPGGDPWIMQNKVGFPTLTNPDTPPVQWTTNPQLEVPFGQAPDDFLPGGRERLSLQETINRVAAMQPDNRDFVISSGRGIPASALRNVADTGPGTGAAPVGIPGGGSNMPEQLSTLSAITQLLGLKDPFHPMLETYYKSPDYLRQKAITEKTAEKQVGLEYDPKIAAATAAATQKYIQENATHESQLKLTNDLIGKGVWFNKDTKKFEPIENAAQAMAEINRVQEQNKADIQLVDTTLTFPGENQPRKVQMTGAQARAIAEGREVQIGGVTIPAMTGIKLGQPVPSEEDKAGIQARGAAQTEMYKAGQKALDTAHDAVRGANQRAPYYGSMLAAAEGFKPGATAEMRLAASQHLKDLGLIKGDNVSQGEQLRLAGERLAFLAVPPNQGSWSNIERQSLKSSIPGMSMTPEGLVEAIRLMQQLDDYDRKVSEIHRQVADKNNGLPNLLEAQRRVEALGPPLTAQQEAALERLRQPTSVTAPAAAATAPRPAAQTGSAPLPGGGAEAPIPPPLPAVGTIRNGYQFIGGDPRNPSSWREAR